MQKQSVRAVAILKAKSGQERELLDFALKAMAVVRKVEGLQKVEISRSFSDSGQLVLYYWWETREHSDRYLKGPFYSQIARGLGELVSERALVIGEMISG